MNSTSQTGNMDENTFPASLFLNIRHSTGGTNLARTVRDEEIPMLVQWTAPTLEAAILSGRPAGTVVFGDEGELCNPAFFVACALKPVVQASLTVNCPYRSRQHSQGSIHCDGCLGVERYI